MSHAGRASIGSAESLFGYEGSDDDVFSRLGPSTQRSDATSYNTHSQSHQNNNTVSEQASVQQQQRDGNHSGNNGVAGQQQQSSQQQYGLDSNVAYDTYSNQSTNYDANQQQQYGEYSNTNGDYVNSEADYVPPQYYPGYIYDYASNSYLEDPNYQPQEDWSQEQQQQQQVGAEGGNELDQYNQSGVQGNESASVSGWGYRSERGQREDSVEEYEQSMETNTTGGYDNQSWEQRSAATANDSQSWQSQQQQQNGRPGQPQDQQQYEESSHDRYSYSAPPPVAATATVAQATTQGNLAQHQSYSNQQTDYDRSYYQQNQQQFSSPDQFQPPSSQQYDAYTAPAQSSYYSHSPNLGSTPTQSSSQFPPQTQSSTLPPPRSNHPAQSDTAPSRSTLSPTTYPSRVFSPPISSPTPPPPNLASRPSPSVLMASPRSVSAPSIPSSSISQSTPYSPQMQSASISQTLSNVALDMNTFTPPTSYNRFAAPEQSYTTYDNGNYDEPPPQQESQIIPPPSKAPTAAHHQHHLSNIAEGYENASSVGEPVDGDAFFSSIVSERVSSEIDRGGNERYQAYESEYSEYVGDEHRSGETPYDQSWEQRDDTPIDTRPNLARHDSDAARRAMEPTVETMTFPPPRPTAPPAPSPPLVVSAIDSLTSDLAAATLEPPPVVQLRRRSFGRRDGTPLSAAAKKAAVDSISLTNITEDDAISMHEDVDVDDAVEDDLSKQEGTNGDRTVVDLEGEDELPLQASDYGRNGYTNEGQYDYNTGSNEFEYGLDGSQVFEDNTATSTAANGYGDWNGGHEQQEEYNNYGNQYNGDQQQYTNYQQAPPNDLYPQHRLPSTSTPPSLYNAPPDPAPQRHAPQQHAPPTYNSSYDPYAPPTLSNATSTYTSPLRSDQQPLHDINVSDPYAYTHQTEQATRSDSYAPYAPTLPQGHVANDSYFPGSAQIPLISVGMEEVDVALIDTQAATRRYDHYAGHQFDPNQAPQIDLGLSKSIAPLVRFGFGGRLVVVFPNSPVAAYSQYGAPMQPIDPNPSTPSTVHIRRLVDVLPPVDASFPGPIFMDGGKANAGKKRKESIIWLDQRIKTLEEQSRMMTGNALVVGSGSGGGRVESSQAYARLILIKIVRVLVENDGMLTGSAKVDDAVRSILAPSESDSLSKDSNGALPLASELAFTAPRQSISHSATNTMVASYTVTSSNLDKLSTFLLRGERETALQYALERKMWAHAFVISSRIGGETWKEVVMEFSRSELAPKFDSNGVTTTEGREALRVAYSLFAGNGSESMSNFLPIRPLAFRAPSTAVALGARPIRPSGVGIISRTASPAPMQMDAASIPTDLSDVSLAKWQDTAAMIVANRMNGDSAALTRLGDTLIANGWFEAAHVCYLLSPATSPIGGVGALVARIVLVGGESPATTSTETELENIMLTELVEFAFSLTPLVKGQEPFAGFPHLQAFRLQHATQLADAGQILQAQRYTDAIVGTLKLATHSSPFYHSGLVAQIKTLSDRLLATGTQDKSGSWIARKVPRPTIDSLWSTLEGRFTKFVAGEGESPVQDMTVKSEIASQVNGSTIGPFSHYSAIAPVVPPTISRKPSQTDLSLGPPPPMLPPHRPSSAAALLPPSLSIATAVSSGPPPVSRGPGFNRTHHARSSSLGFAGYNYDPSAPSPINEWQSYTPPVASPRYQLDPPSNEPANGSNHNYEPASSFGNAPQYEPQSAQTQTSAYDTNYDSQQQQDDDVEEESGLRAPVFSTLDEAFAEDESGFITPMATYSPAPTPGPPSSYSALNANRSHQRNSTRAELDDLGIGNSRSKKPGFDSIDEHAGEGEDSSSKSSLKVESSETRPQVKPSRSWLGGWFKRETGGASSPQTPAGPGPVKANLGEQTSFVFDPEQKKWVNKKTGGDIDTRPITTAPPPRAATASPSRARGSSSLGSTPPPPLPEGAHLRSSLDPPPLNRSKTSADLGQMNRASAGEFRSSSTGPPPRSGTLSPAPSLPSSGTSTPISGVRRKQLKNKYLPVR